MERTQARLSSSVVPRRLQVCVVSLLHCVTVHAQPAHRNVTSACEGAGALLVLVANHAGIASDIILSMMQRATSPAQTLCWSISG
jgi:hypothetical protein